MISNDYGVITVVSTAEFIQSFITWPFSRTLTDLDVFAINTATGEVKSQKLGEITVSLIGAGAASPYTLTTNPWFGDVDNEAEIRVYRSSPHTQTFDTNGVKFDPVELVAQLDKEVKVLQEIIEEGIHKSIKSIDPFIIPSMQERANTIINFDENGDYEAFSSDYEAGVGVTFFPASVEGETPSFGIAGFPTGGVLKSSAMKILLDAGPSYPGHWVDHSTDADYFNFNKPVLSEGLQLAYVAAGNVGDVLIDDGFGSPEDSGVQIDDVMIKIPGGNANRLVKTDAVGQLVDAGIEYTTGLLQLVGSSALAIKASAGFEGFDLTLDGGTDPSRLIATGQGVTTTLESKVSLASLVANAPLLISSTDLLLFQDQPSASRPLNIYGGVVGSQGSARITVNELSANRARFAGDVNEWNFIGSILENGVPILDSLSQGQTIATSFIQANIQNDAGGDYYLLVHSFDSVEAVHISVYDEDDQEIQTVNVKDSGDPDNRIKIYVNGYTPIVGTFRISAFVGAPASTITGDLTADEIAAIKNAPTPGTAINPFITVADQVGAQLTPDELAGIQGAATSLTALNPVVTVADQQLTPDQLAGIQNAPTALTAINPAVSVLDLPHSLGGSVHNADTLANLNSKITDANLDDVNNARTPTSHSNSAHSETYITSSGVIYEALAANDDIGQVASTVAAGNDSRFLTAAQKAGVANSPTPITAVNPAVSQADLSTLIPGVMSRSNCIHVQSSPGSGTAGQSFGANPNGFYVRSLDATVTNTISGASRSGNDITLPAGNYIVRGFAAINPEATVCLHQLRIRNTGDTTTYASGSSERTSGNTGDDSTTKSELNDYPFTLASPTIVNVSQFINEVGGVSGNPIGGFAASSGEPELYVDVVFYKV